MTNYDKLSNWCGAKPTFFNRRTGAQSFLMDDVIDWSNAEIDHEGLYYYLRNGYSSFGRTFVKDVLFTRPWSEEADDITLSDYDRFQRQLSEVATIDLALQNIKESIANDTFSNDEIIIPMSGGLDSRTLAILVPEEKNVSAYSYNLIEPAEKCHENGIAKLVCDKLGIPHYNIKLGNPYVYAQAWFDNLGLSAQSHGMYHYDFFDTIQKDFSLNGIVLSGIVGDAWSGKISTREPKKSEDLFNFGYSHGQSIPKKVIKFTTTTESMDHEFQLFKQVWGNPKFRMYYLINTKMMLLRFLLMAPRNSNFEVASPFLDPNVCASILNLPTDQWSNRVWQTEWLSSLGMQFSDGFINYHYSKRNDCVFNWAVSNERDEPLDITTLSNFIKPQFISHLNRAIENTTRLKFLHKLVGTPKIGGALRKLGIEDHAVQIINWYNILLPVSKFLKNVHYVR